MAIDPRIFDVTNFLSDPALAGRAMVDDVVRRQHAAMMEVVRYLRLLNRSFIEVGEVGYIVRKFPEPPPQADAPSDKKSRREGLIETFTRQERLAGLDDWEAAAGQAP